MVEMEGAADVVGSVPEQRSRSEHSKKLPLKKKKKKKKWTLKGVCTQKPHRQCSVSLLSVLSLVPAMGFKEWTVNTFRQPSRRYLVWMWPVPILTILYYFVSVAATSLHLGSFAVSEGRKSI